MEKPNEPLLAAALWAFIERLRREEDPLAAGLDGLTAEDAEELAALFRTAEGLRLALADRSCDLSAHAAGRLRAAIADRAQSDSPRKAQQSPTPRAMARLSSVRGLTERRWSLVAAAASLVLGILIGQRLPSADPLEHPPSPIQALSHMQTREQAPLLVAGKLPSPEARAVLWHLAHCDGCFQAYQRMRSSRVAMHPAIARSVF